MIALISDIDNTLTGDTEGLAGLNAFLKQNRKEIFIVYATGRNLEFYNQALEREGLLQPDAAIINTGADVYDRKEGSYIFDTEWNLRMKSSQYDPELIKRALQKVEGIDLQDFVYDFKVSYFIDRENAGLIKRSTAEALRRAGICADLIISHGKYLDILPAGCDKGSAAVHLLKKKGLNAGQAIVAGDSENDIGLFNCFKNGIVVMNAFDGLKQKLKNRNFYFAEASFGKGVLEGLRHYSEKFLKEEKMGNVQ